MYGSVRGTGKFPVPTRQILHFIQSKKCGNALTIIYDYFHSSFRTSEGAVLIGNLEDGENPFYSTLNEQYLLHFSSGIAKFTFAW